MIRKKSNNNNKNKITTLVGEEAFFEGNISTSSARIDGSFKGEAKLHGNLVVGEKGLITGDINAPKVIVFGKVEGKIKANALEVKETGNIEGDIEVQFLNVDTGGIINSNCLVMKQMDEEKEGDTKSEVASFEQFRTQK